MPPVEWPTPDGIASAAATNIDLSNPAPIIQRESGIELATVGVVPRNLLDAKISELTFVTPARYQPELAIVTLEQSPVVEAISRRLGISPMGETYEYRALVPDPRLPHLPATLRKQTVAQIRGMIAGTFHVLVLFGACEDPRVYFTGVFGLGA